MASRRTYYFRQKVQPAELNAGFTALENADWAYAVDTGSFGITAGGAVTQRGAGANMTVDVAGLFTAYDQLGRRVAWTPVQNVDCSVDYLGNPTTVLVGGNNKILSIFAVFTRVDSDPRTDGNGATVQFQNDEGFTIKVVQSSETVSPTAPALLNPGVLLADVALAFGQTTIVNGNISITRRQDQIVVSGSPQSLRRGLIKTAIADVLGFYNAHVIGGADRHTASMVDYGGGTTWSDGTTNPAATVEVQLDKIVSDLRGTGGAAKIGTNTTSAFADAVTIGPGNVQTVISAIISALAAASGAGKVGSAVTGAWADTTTVAAGTVQSSISGIVSALAGTAGAGKIGTAGASSWKDGTTNPATTVEGQLDKIVTDLINNAGAARVGAATFGTWADSSTVSNPSSIQAGLAAIVNALGATTGSAKVGGAALPNWADGSTVASAAAAIQTQLANIINGLTTVTSRTVQGARYIGFKDDGTLTNLQAALPTTVADAIYAVKSEAAPLHLTWGNYIVYATAGTAFYLTAGYSPDQASTGQNSSQNICPITGVVTSFGCQILGAFPTASAYPATMTFQLRKNNSVVKTITGTITSGASYTSANTATYTLATGVAVSAGDTLEILVTNPATANGSTINGEYRGWVTIAVGNS